MDGKENEWKQISSYREGKHKLVSIRWMLFFVVAVQTAVTVVFAVVSSFFDPAPPVYLQLLGIELLAYLIPLSLYAKENRILTAREARERFGLKRYKPSLSVWILLLGLGCQFVMILLNLPVNLILSQSDGYIPQSVGELVFAILVIGLIPAVFEEFLLRGIVYGIMAEYNSRAAMIFTTVMFALMHGNPSGVVGYLFLGAMLVIVLRRTGSLYACMLVHFVNNLTALLLSYANGVLMETPIMTLQLFAGGVLAFLVGWVLLQTVTKRLRSTLKIKTGEFLGQNFINLPILLCIASVIGMLVLG